MVRPSDESINLTISGPTKTLKIQGFDHKWQDFWSDQGRNGRTVSAGPEGIIISATLSTVGLPHIFIYVNCDIIYLLKVMHGKAYPWFINLEPSPTAVYVGINQCFLVI